MNKPNLVFKDIREINISKMAFEEYTKEVMTIFNSVTKTLLNGIELSMKFNNLFEANLALEASKALEKVWQFDSKNNWQINCDDRHSKKCIKCFIDDYITKNGQTLH